MPHNPPHDAIVDQSQEVLQRRFPPPQWRVRVQSAITTPDSEPEPDVVLAPGPASRYLDHHPEPEEIELLVEVSDSTLNDDRQHKGRLYSRARIAVYWIVNLILRQIEVYSDPSGPDPNPSYRNRQDYQIGEEIPVFVGGQEAARIPVAEFFA